MGLTTLISLFTGAGLLAAVPSELPGKPARLSFEAEQGATTAFVVKGQLQGVDWGGFTPRWVHPKLVLNVNCPGVVRKVELRGAGEKLLRTLTMPEDSTLHGTRFDLDLPVWSTQEAVLQCQTGNAILERPLNATLFCQGRSEQKHAFAVKLAVSCDAPVPEHVVSVRDLMLRLDAPYGYRVGSTEPVTVGVDLNRLTPRPTEANVVEIDAGGKVVRRLAPLALPEELRGQQLRVSLDTKEARTARVAVEARFSDGSTWVGSTKTQEIITGAAMMEREQAWADAESKMMAFEDRFGEKFKDRCTDLDATMKWLREQPEIEHASVSGNGHSFYYKVKGALSGMSYICHRR
jgi:hypothetical protein